MKKVPKWLSITGNVLLWIFVVFAVLITILTFTAQTSDDGLPSIFGTSPVSVLSNSMEPEFSKGDLIFVKKISQLDAVDTLKVGDVITFYADINDDGYNEINTHRIVEIDKDSTPIKYQTAGDNNIVDGKVVNDKYVVSIGDVLAIYSGNRLPGVGGFISFLQTKVGFFLIIVLPLVLFFLFELANFIMIIKKLKGKKEITKEDEEEIKRRAVLEYIRLQQASGQAPQTATNNSDNEQSGENAENSENNKVEDKEKDNDKDNIADADNANDIEK